MSRGRELPKQTQESLLFISANPSSKQERSNTLRLVRSHVGRWRQKQIRKANHQSIEWINDAQVTSLEHRSTAREEIEPFTSTPYNESPFSDPFSSPLVVELASSREDAVENQEELQIQARDAAIWDTAITASRQSSMERSTISNPRCIDANILDPFQAHVVSPLSSKLVSASNKYSLSTLWPGLMPLSCTGNTHSGVQNWFSSSRVHPALHSAMLFGSYSHRRAQWLMKGQGHFGVEDMNHMRICENETISRINVALQDEVQAVSDAVILSVLCLATNKYDGAVWEPDAQDAQSPFAAPLRSLQWLDVYGRLSPNPVHQAGLARLIQLRGGLEKLKLPGLAAVISFSSVLGASKSLSRPHLPFISLQNGHQMVLQDILNIQDPGIPEDPLVEIHITPEMHDVFRGLRQYVSLVEEYQHGVERIDHIILCDHRNLIQWHVMSLLPASQLGPVILPFCPMYEPCRLSLMIFAIGITFPLPPDTASLAKLARTLQIELKCLGQSDIFKNNESTEMYYWCLVIGGIVATVPEREWFVQELVRCTGTYDVSTWNDLEVVLKRCLWWNIACDSAAKQLWAEVEDLMPANTVSRSPS
ncbi:hypothetical protein BGW36DRAFT_19646 [Talaromyces proteolyticus]|uniref:Transcription factor domain-containing protein n=1 Tax=Talaromyces proteolyticus TaxID=1131652 RepID=A0AAD4L2D6_9EURO|nr:uncharacterized protein BGW36DRAFT_19646 [Talaromyces proteolyticus]KAH8705929.1 hypothetical protein BGW36DRAFT_19646 [Talaromyces proteolyticus]